MKLRQRAFLHVLLQGSNVLCRNKAQAYQQEPSEIVLNHQIFADDLTTELYSSNDENNECTSAWGVNLAFSLIYPSSINEAKTQIQNVFGYPSSSRTSETITNPQSLVWNETVSRMDAAYEGECQNKGDDGVCYEEVEPTLEIANSVWVNIASELNSEYEAIVREYLYQIDFSDESAGSTVNKWVNDSTRGLVDSMVDNGPIRGIELLAVNSIYLKAAWLQQFSERSTTQDLFYSSPSRITTTLSEAYFMHQVKEFQYSHTAIPGYQIVKLAFIGDSLSMLVVLPKNEDLTLDSFLLSTDLIDALPQLEKTRIALALPKFKFMTTYNDDLKSSLQSIGLTAPFIGGLCIFKNDCSSFVSEIIQKTVIDVNEEGVEAAAVTMIVSRTSGFITIERPIEFLADHPFQFFIYDSNEGLMIFEGRVGNPGIPEGSTEPSLKASHTDEDFWLTNFGVDVIVVDPPVEDDSITYSTTQTNVENNNSA